MLYREIIAVCSEIHTEEINEFGEKNAEFLGVERGGTLVTTGPEGVITQSVSINYNR
jgi:hypothetical protein